MNLTHLNACKTPQEESYIKNPDPRGIMILRKASCRFPMERFQELFFSHISKQPDPRINLTQDVSGYGSSLKHKYKV
ncbi:hypothetical protein J7337_006422 [Fusarium musae]|uniref:Uncharacterized protein n=1 Tax=Fusarium musae TaxID=1042133 RepID=A0A9P8DFC5_9HYPO|nr:hypothetical protein J7337_006422 [Fusarium musae]KAG9500742.1 hypothetical protein J7337_006422 [Fusarium musae]